GSAETDSRISIAEHFAGGWQVFFARVGKQCLGCDAPARGDAIAQGSEKQLAGPRIVPIDLDQGIAQLVDHTVVVCEGGEFEESGCSAVWFAESKQSRHG